MPRSPQLPKRSARAAVLTLAATAAVATVVAAAVATGQFRIGRFPVIPPGAQPHDDKDAPVGVTVPDSPGALERLNHAAEKQQQQQWKVAAEFYREAVAQFPGRVVPASADHAGGTYRYTGVAAAVQERLAKWPPAGLAVYRNLYGPAAADRLAAAGRGDLASLASIFYDDFVTDAGKGAGVRLIDAYAEAGDFPAAAEVGRRLLDLHPMLGSDRPAILFRTALVCHWGATRRPPINGWPTCGSRTPRPSAPWAGRTWCWPMPWPPRWPCPPPRRRWTRWRPTPTPASVGPAGAATCRPPPPSRAPA